MLQSQKVVTRVESGDGPCRFLFKLGYQGLQAFKPWDGRHRLNLQFVHNCDERRLADLLCQGVRLVNATRGPFHYFCHIRLELGVGDVIRSTRTSSPPENLAVDCVSQDPPEPFDPCRRLLIDRASLDSGRTCARCGAGLVRTVRSRQCPLRKLGKLHWLRCSFSGIQISVKL